MTYIKLIMCKYQCSGPEWMLANHDWQLRDLPLVSLGGCHLNIKNARWLDVDLFTAVWQFWKLTCTLPWFQICKSLNIGYPKPQDISYSMWYHTLSRQYLATRGCLYFMPCMICCGSGLLTKCKLLTKWV